MNLHQKMLVVLRPMTVFDCRTCWFVHHNQTSGRLLPLIWDDVGSEPHS